MNFSFTLNIEEYGCGLSWNVFRVLDLLGVVFRSFSVCELGLWSNI